MPCNVTFRRKQILEEAKSGRAQRQNARRQDQAARTLQRHWRGRTARAALRGLLAQQWLQRYAPHVADKNSMHGKDELLSQIFPPVLAACLLPFHHVQAGLTHGAPVQVDPCVRPALRGFLALALRSLLATAPAENVLATTPG